MGVHIKLIVQVKKKKCCMVSIFCLTSVGHGVKNCGRGEGKKRWSESNGWLLFCQIELIVTGCIL